MIHRNVACCQGSHRPRRPCVQAGDALRYTICRDCGAALFQTAVSRKWILSGMLT